MCILTTVVSCVPIIQNNLLVSGVIHVFVNNPAKEYGISE